MEALEAEDTIDVDGKQHRFVDGWKQTVFEFSAFGAVAAFLLGQLLISDADAAASDLVVSLFIILMLAVSVPGLVKNFKLLTHEAWSATTEDLRQHWKVTALMSVSMGVSLGWLLAALFYGDVEATHVGLVVAAGASIYTLFQVRPRTV